MSNMNNRKLRGGMAGGSIKAFIGPVHRMAATMDGQAEFVSGCFSRNAETNKKTGEALYMEPERVYSSYSEMAEKEQKLPDGERIDFVSIVTPNNVHFDAAKTFLEAGFNVICDKPMCMNLKEAKTLRDIVKKSGKVFALTHNYTGYPMVKQAREMVKQEVFGKINKIVVEYPQGWLSGLILDPKSGSGWRMDPSLAGGSCCIGDIGTHAENLVRYITGLKIDELCAELTSFIPGNKLDDDGNMLIRYIGGAKGVLHASQISAGEENGLNIRAYGAKGGFEWHQENPNYLIVKDPKGLAVRYSKGTAAISDIAKKAGRLPFGHPDGFIEAFANIYMEAYKTIRAAGENKKYEGDYPTVEDGVIGNAFIETVLLSSKSKDKWTKMLE
jgi:predicted dehydrogenase